MMNSLFARLGRSSFVWPLSAAFAVVGTVAAQPLVEFGEHRSASIDAVGQTRTYFLQGVRAGDVLRLSFASQYSGYPNNYYHHLLKVHDGATLVGNPISGAGTLTVELTSANIHTITVRAIDNQRRGWFAFQVDRLNQPVGADRIAHGWQMSGRIDRAAEFAMRTIRAEAGSTAGLRFTSQWSGYPNNYYHCGVQLVDSAGNEVASVSGNTANPVPITFQTTDTYVLYVYGLTNTRTGTYAATLECTSMLSSPCDTQADWSHYGLGWAGTQGVPELTSTALPTLGSTIGIRIGNSLGAPTFAVLAVSPFPANAEVSGYGGTLLVEDPAVVEIASLPAGGTTVPLSIPVHPLLIGRGFAAQSFVQDAGAAVGGVAFSRGLLLLTGN